VSPITFFGKRPDLFVECGKRKVVAGLEFLLELDYFKMG